MSYVRKLDAKAVSTTEKAAPLRTKYYCQVNNKETVDVVMELSAVKKAIERRLPLRYVMVIDVSGSMGFRTGKNNLILLDRVKIFADLLVQNVARGDSLAIVTFSNDVHVDMPITCMDRETKKKARTIVKSLCTRGSTNLEIGLMKALDVLKSRSSANNRDMIILFTDGMANEGIIDPVVLMRMYKEAQTAMKKTSCIPVAALTIGVYVPTLLYELAKYLGSDAFYWLNEKEEFEADMLIPVFLREATQITDVMIEIKCLKEVKFSVEDICPKHMLESSDEVVKYFIHSIPVATCKHIYFTLHLPQRELEKLSGKHIAEIKATYLDAEINQREINDFVVLCVTTLAECKRQFYTNTGDKSTDKIFDSISAYTMTRRELRVAWGDAQTSLVAVAAEKYRKLSIAGIYSAKYYIIEGDMQSRDVAIKSAISGVSDVKKTYAQLLGERSKYTDQLTNNADEWISTLNFGNTINTQDNLGRLFAMLSSIETEMPSTKGVFGPKAQQPYLPSYVGKKLREYEKIAKKAKKDQQAFRTIGVFKAQNILVSETLRDKKVGEKQETMSELIIRCGGRPVPNVNTVYNNTLLVCSDKDYMKNTVLVRDSKLAKIPIVREQFIYDCIQEKKIVELENYLINTKGATISAVS